LLTTGPSIKSADEAYLDCSSWGWSRALELAKTLKKDIETHTECPCSVGIGPNKLVREDY